MKIIKLTLIAVVTIGVLIGAIVLFSGRDGDADKPKFENVAAKAQMAAIDKLCDPKANNWSTEKYTDLSNEIWQEYTQSNGRLLSLDEATNLKEYLFSCSAKLAWDKANALFKLKSYPAAELKKVQTMANFLSAQQKEFGTNTNATKAASICGQWATALSASSWRPGVTYSRPLRAYSGDGATNAIRRVEGLSYYKSHFKNNSELASRLARIRNSASGGAAEYYNSLERAIEQHYNAGSPSHAKLEQLMEDQTRFASLPGVPSSAVSRLQSYVNSYLSRL